MGPLDFVISQERWRECLCRNEFDNDGRLKWWGLERNYEIKGGENKTDVWMFLRKTMVPEGENKRKRRSLNAKDRRREKIWMTGVLNSVENKFYYINGSPATGNSQSKFPERITAWKHRPPQDRHFRLKGVWRKEQSPYRGTTISTDKRRTDRLVMPCQSPYRGTTISTANPDKFIIGELPVSIPFPGNSP